MFLEDWLPLYQIGCTGRKLVWVNYLFWTMRPKNLGQPANKRTGLWCLLSRITEVFMEDFNKNNIKGKNFEENIIFCFFKNGCTMKVKIIESDQKTGNLPWPPPLYQFWASCDRWSTSSIFCGQLYCGTQPCKWELVEPWSINVCLYLPISVLTPVLSSTGSLHFLHTTWPISVSITAWVRTLCQCEGE